MTAKRVIVLTGPTASGKSAVAMELAIRIGGEILCMDSMQVYKGLDIGTAKPTAAERRRVRHHLLDLCEPEENFSVSDYTQRCEPLLLSVDQPILAGGTGLYLDGLMYRRTFGGAGADESLRAEYHRFADEHGNAALFERLRMKDPKAAAKLHPNDVRRVIRALEVIETTGQSIAAAIDKQRREDFDFRLYAISLPRETLYRRIDARVDAMMAAGLLEEVHALFDRRVPRDAQAIQGLGYKELYACFLGETTLAEAVNLIKLRTRHYAKRQLTWFHRVEGLSWLPMDDPGANAARILEEIQ
ncbi:MAG: tRNA (adenosine(37)-N6)-dimethylallyltransferase MiaA [Clostridia bacterium]|nr:tRNA (adenosine(37)-N6)-dimethylallyltransferase MiaA [Clostridia bacterium]